MMKNRKNNIIAILIAAVMVFAMMPAMAFADGEDVEIVKAIASSADVNITKGKVSPGKALSSGSSASFGVYALADNGHTATVNVKDVSVSVNNTFVIGIAAYAGDPTDKTSGHVNVTAGNVASRETGVDVNVSEKSDAAVTINGDVTAGAFESDYGNGMMVQSNDGSLAEATVNGNISAKSNGLIVSATTETPQTPASAKVKVLGDVTTTDQNGILFQGKTDTQDVLVTGTVNSSKYGIVSDTYYSPNMGTENGLTVWKIVTGSGNADDLFVKRVNDSEYEPDSDSAKAANYIVKYHNAGDDNDVVPLKADGTALAKSHDYPVAKEGDKVLITAKNGNVVTKAYNNGTEITTKDEQGFFYIVVPRGGGIDITAEVGDTPGPTPGPGPAPAPTKVAAPSGKTLTYNGKAQTGVVAGTGYTLSGTTSATNAGSYQAKATLKEGYAWTDGTTDAKTIGWKINKAVNPLTIKAKTAIVKFSKLKKKNQTLTVGKVMTLKNKGQGTRTYKLVSAKKGKKSFKKYFAVNKKTGKVTVKKKLKKGTYKVKINVTAAGNGNYNKVTKPVSVTIKVK